jgi:ubiquinol-cytochrome c reductase core subunit 2
LSFNIVQPLFRPFFVDVLTSFVTSAKLNLPEFTEYVAPLIEADTQTASHDPATQALEAAHALAFRHGLGQSLFAPAHHSLSIGDIRSFATSVLSKNNIAVLGTGIDQGTLKRLVEAGLDGAPSSPSVVAPPSKYFGGETRLESRGTHRPFSLDMELQELQTLLPLFLLHISPQRPR